jgi:hypothetical protein
MRESTDRVESALRSEDPIEQLIASRLMENASTFQIWESEHSGLMREVANTGFKRTQAALLKKATLRLIHRKALFEYLRDRQIRGDARRRLVLSFHPTQHYTQAVVSEHSIYLRRACSFLCTSHVGANIVHDAGFFDPMSRYQELYREYFQLYCRTHIGTPSADTEAQTELLPLLKFQLEECRYAIMNPQPGDWLKREAELREPTGETVRMKRPDIFKR